MNVSLSSESNGSVSSGSVGRVAFVTGLDLSSGQALGYVGIAPGANVGSTETSGSASYSTQYEYQVIDNVARTSSTIGGDRLSEDGNLTLNANFGAGTLTGSNSELSVNGTINGRDLDGTVTANYSATVIGSGGLTTVNGSVDGDLSGMIGSDGVIGAFHGNDSNTILVGGIVGTQN